MLKKFLISAVFGAAALGTIPAMAVEGPNFTKDELATIKTYNQFSTCLTEGMDTIAKQAIPVIKKIITARDTASSQATIDAAKEAGMTDEQTVIMAQAMVNADGRALYELIMKDEQDSQIITCAKEAGIANKDGTGIATEFDNKVAAVEAKKQKYMEEAMKAQQQAPKP